MSVRPLLGEYLLAEKIITPLQLEVALREQKRHPDFLGRLLISMGFITSAQLLQALSFLQGVPAIDLNAWLIDPACVEILPRPLMESFLAIAIENTETHVTVAMADVENITACDEMTRLIAPKQLKRVLADETLLRTCILAQNTAHPTQTAENPPEFLREIVKNALGKNASDIHFIPQEHIVDITLRCDGILTPYYTLHKPQWSALINHLKVMAQLNLAETRRPQDGQIQFFFCGQPLSCRLSFIPTYHGESLVIRLLPHVPATLDLAQLGFPTIQQAYLKDIAQQPQGVFIVSGPTGSGKTTTLYALLNQMNRQERAIMTLENPLEYPIPGIRQIPFDASVLPLSDALRAILRHDPDVIYISEIRDEITAQMAWRAAMTGHLVFATLHTTDVCTIPYRLADLGIPLKEQAGIYVGMMAQRLIRRTCCLHATCTLCHGRGYYGRTVVAEYLPQHAYLDAHLGRSGTLQDLRTWHAQNFPTLAHNAHEKIRAGYTDSLEVQRVLGLGKHEGKSDPALGAVA